MAIMPILFFTHKNPHTHKDTHKQTGTHTHTHTHTHNTYTTGSILDWRKKALEQSHHVHLSQVFFRKAGKIISTFVRLTVLMYSEAQRLSTHVHAPGRPGRARGMTS